MRGTRTRLAVLGATLALASAAPLAAVVPETTPAALAPGSPPAPSAAAPGPVLSPTPSTAPAAAAVPTLPDPATVRRAGAVAARPGWTSVLGDTTLDASQLAAWFRSVGKRERTPLRVEALARLFVEEGRAQGVRADLAFVQSILETGWFGYAGSMVGPRENNFSGLGACDRCRKGNRFPSPRAGVRAQIQHLLAYADPLADQKLATPLIDGRFAKVSPLGKAPFWELMGSGNWATGRGYGRQVLGLWREALAFHGLRPPTGASVVAERSG